MAFGAKVSRAGHLFELFLDAVLVFLFILGGAYLLLTTDRQGDGAILLGVGLAPLLAVMFRNQIRAWWSSRKA